VKKNYSFKSLIEAYVKENDGEDKPFLGEIIKSIQKFVTLSEVKELLINVI
jgi:hypothetical protein